MLCQHIILIHRYLQIRQEYFHIPQSLHSIIKNILTLSSFERFEFFMNTKNSYQNPITIDTVINELEQNWTLDWTTKWPVKRTILKLRVFLQLIFYSSITHCIYLLKYTYLITIFFIIELNKND